MGGGLLRGYGWGLLWQRFCKDVVQREQNDKDELRLIHLDLSVIILFQKSYSLEKQCKYW